MKKMIMLVALFATISLTAQAQLKFGVKGGLNLSKLSLDKQVITSGNQMGFFIGPTLKLQIPVIGIGIDAAALYDQRSGILEESKSETHFTDDVKLKQQSILIPVNVRWGFGIGSLATVFVFGGPQFGFNVGDKVTTFHNDSNHKGVDFKFEDTSLSANIGLGVLLFKHLQVSLNYNWAFTDAGKFEVIDGIGQNDVDNHPKSEIFGMNGAKTDSKFKTWQLALAYYF